MESNGGHLQKMIALLAKELRIGQIANYGDIVKAELSFEENLFELLKSMAASREEISLARRIKIGNLLPNKNFDTFEFDPKTLPHVSLKILEELRSCEFVTKKMDIILIGPPGRGKTHLANALGIEATKKRHKVRFVVADKMLTAMMEAQNDRELAKITESLIKPDLLIVDEVGYFTYSPSKSNMLFRVIRDRNENASTIVTTNYEFTRWKEFMSEQGLTLAMVDRLVFLSTVLDMSGPGPSYRLRMGQKRLRMREELADDE